MVEEASSHCSRGGVTEETAQPDIIAVVPDEAGDLDLMHREDHAGRGAGRAEDRADVGDVGGAAAVAAEFGRDQHAEQTLLADRGEGFGRKARLAIDRFGILFCDLGGLLRAIYVVAGVGGLAGPDAPVDERKSVNRGGHVNDPLSYSQ